jgi:hypothetical protein
MSLFSEFEAHLKAEVIKILEELDLYHPPAAPSAPTAPSAASEPASVSPSETTEAK